jgi:valyl-tRNA synthetase
MSKTAGNVTDPLDVLNEYGTDALRFTLLTGSTPGNDMNLNLQRVEASRNFANKIWNAARFIVTNLEDADNDVPLACLSLPDQWIVSRLNRLIAEVTELFDTFQHGEAGRRIHDFLWNEFCDWYIEACKIRLVKGNSAPAERATAQATLVSVLERALRLLHPFMPFVTEEIWQHLKAAWPGAECCWEEALIITPWPKADPALRDDQAEEDMALLMDLIRQIRNARAEFDVTPGKPIPAIVAAGDKLPLLEGERGLLTFLARVDEQQLTLSRTVHEKPHKAIALVAAHGVEAYLPLAGMVDLDQETARLRKALAEVEREIQRARGMLANESFVSKAPAHVIQQQRDRLAEQQERRSRLQARLQALES